MAININNNGQNWSIVAKLSSSLITDNYLCKNENNQYLIMKECNEFFLKKLKIRNDDALLSFIDNADITHRFYSKIYEKRIEDSIEGIKYRNFGEYSRYQLFELLRKSRKNRLTEKVARYYMFQLVDVFENLHAKRVYYLTLRPEDLQLNDKFELKLNDCGISSAVFNSFTNFEWVKEICNKNTTLSPEVSSATQISEKSDLFNLGVLLFSMVVGFRPFREQNILSDYLYNLIYNNEKDKYWLIVQKSAKIDLSMEFKDLVFRMLSVDLNNRIGLDEIRKHPWIMSNDIPHYDTIYDFFYELVNNMTKKVLQR